MAIRRKCHLSGKQISCFLPGISLPAKCLPVPPGHTAEKGNCPSLLKCCQHSISATCISKDGILVGAEERILGQKPSIFSKEPLLYCPGFYQFCHSAELSVPPALKGNGSLKTNLRHLQMHNVHWRLPLLPVWGLRWQRFCQGKRWPGALIALQECPLLISSGLLGEHKLTCALEAGFISCLPAMTWKFWWTLESFTQTFGFNECM